MRQPFFLEHMVNLIHAPFYVFDDRKQMIQKFGGREIETILFEKNRIPRKTKNILLSLQTKFWYSQCLTGVWQRKA